jgi:hypothetical protein
MTSLSFFAKETKRPAIWKQTTERLARIFITSHQDLLEDPQENYQEDLQEEVRPNMSSPRRDPYPLSFASRSNTIVEDRYAETQKATTTEDKDTPDVAEGSQEGDTDVIEHDK